jgi:hypothetical protein
VIRLEGIGGDKIPRLVVDEALHAVGPKAVGIEQNDSEDEYFLKGVCMTESCTA